MTPDIVDADRPETIYRHVLNDQLVHRFPVIGLGKHAGVDGVFLWVQAPTRRRGQQMADRINHLPGAHPHEAVAAPQRLQARQVAANLG